MEEEASGMSDGGVVTLSWRLELSGKVVDLGLREAPWRVQFSSSCCWQSQSARVWWGGYEAAVLSMVDGSTEYGRE